jgi:predicted metalloendopeptidase
MMGPVSKIGAFDVKPSDKLYSEPASRVKIW